MQVRATRKLCGRFLRTPLLKRGAAFSSDWYDVEAVRKGQQNSPGHPSATQPPAPSEQLTRSLQDKDENLVNMMNKIMAESDLEVKGHEVTANIPIFSDIKKPTNRSRIVWEPPAKKEGMFTASQVVDMFTDISEGEDLTATRKLHNVPEDVPEALFEQFAMPMMIKDKDDDDRYHGYWTIPEKHAIDEMDSPVISLGRLQLDVFRREKELEARKKLDATKNYKF